MRGLDTLRRWLTGWRFVRGARTVSPQSMWAWLHRYLPAAELAQIAALTPDRRCIARAVGVVAGVTEDEILRAWCVRREFDYLERIPVADFSLLPAPVSRELLSSYGATVITEDERINQIVCVDPDRIDGLREILAGIPVAVARWDEIQRHLDDSSHLGEELNDLRTREASQRLRETSEAVLGLIVHEVIERGHSCVTIDTSGEDPTYTVVDNGGEEAQGHLHSMIRPALEELLSSDEIEVIMPSGDPFRVTIERDSSRRRFIVRWHREVPPLVEKVDGTILPSRRDDGEAKRGSLRGTIFVIDDDAGFSGVLTRFLTRLGFAVQSFLSAEEAWRTLEEGAELDLIVCDVHMAGMGGYDFVRRLRATNVGADIPLIALSSDEEVETEVQLLRAGVDAFVSKSVDPRILSAHIERCCDTRVEGARI